MSCECPKRKYLQSVQLIVAVLSAVTNFAWITFVDFNVY